MSSSGSNVGMEMSVPLVDGIVNNTVLLQVTYQSDAASNHSHPALFLVDCMPRFCNLAALRSGLLAARSLEVHTGLLLYCTFGLEAVNIAQNVRVDTACRKDNDQQNLS